MFRSRVRKRQNETSPYNGTTRAKEPDIGSHVRPLHRPIRKSNKKTRKGRPVSASGVAVFACCFPIGRPRQNCSAGWFFSREKIEPAVRTGRVGSGSR